MQYKNTMKNIVQYYFVKGSNNKIYKKYLIRYLNCCNKKIKI